MLLAVDIGNTNIVAAVFDGDLIVRQFRIASDKKRTSDEYTSVLMSLLRDNDIPCESITKSIISSVVPDLIGPFVTVCCRVTGKHPYLVTSKLGSNGSLPVRLPHEILELGTDLLSNAVGAWKLFDGKPNIVVDFGTALSTICTDSTGVIRGVTITPGLRTAVHALNTDTAQLPTVPLEAPESSLGLSTVTAIQSGIVLGYKGLVEYLVNQIKADMGKISGDKPEDIVVVATGGLNSVLKPITEVFTYVDKDLTVKGLKLISDIAG